MDCRIYQKGKEGMINMHYQINHIEHPYQLINNQALTIKVKNTVIEEQDKQIKDYRRKYNETMAEKDRVAIKASKEIVRLRAEKHQLTEAYNQLAIKLQSTERQLETMKACDADKARQLKGFHSENRRRLNMAVISPDRHFDSKPRKEG